MQNSTYSLPSLDLHPKMKILDESVRSVYGLSVVVAGLQDTSTVHMRKNCIATLLLKFTNVPTNIAYQYVLGCHLCDKSDGNPRDHSIVASFLCNIYQGNLTTIPIH